VIVEIDGVGHLQVQQWHADLGRHNALSAATGAVMLRVTAWEVRHDPGPFFTLLSAVITRGCHPCGQLMTAGMTSG